MRRDWNGDGNVREERRETGSGTSKTIIDGWGGKRREEKRRETSRAREEKNRAEEKG